MIWIGIDTGRDTGFAVWDSRKKRLVEVRTVRIHEAMRDVLRWRLIAELAGTTVHVVFEDARRRKWIPREKSLSEFKGRAIGAGHVMRDATVWQDFLEDEGVPFMHPGPTAGLTKWNEDAFKRITGWKGRTSHHGRDAALLVWGK